MVFQIIQCVFLSVSISFSSEFCLVEVPNRYMQHGKEVTKPKFFIKFQIFKLILEKIILLY